MYKSALFLFVFFYCGISLAQTPQGRQGMRDPSQMANQEKKLLLDSIESLNEDQKLIIEEIYRDYAESLKKVKANMQTGDREAMRSKMLKVREEKTEALKAILTEDQYQRFETLMRARREQFRNRRPNRNE